MKNCISYLFYILIYSCIFQYTFAQSNHISIENTIQGTSDWQLSNPASQREIEGYASATSVQVNDSILFYVNTKAPEYVMRIYRMGWYQGLGGRLMKDSIILKGTEQKIPKLNKDTGSVECNWKQPYSLKIPSEWTTGIYVSKLEETKTQKQSYIIFVVKNDEVKADILFQLPVNTYQAYNYWGGKSLYDFSSGNELPWGSSEGKHASKVSFNRPYAGSLNENAMHGIGAGEFFTNVQPNNNGYPISNAGWDYNMVRWLEKKGYSTNYITNIDTHTSTKTAKNNTVFLSNGHDEYWTLSMRNNVVESRNKGMHLAFFSANTAYWQIRLEPDQFGKENRTIVCYKSKKNDPVKGENATVNFRDPTIDKPESSFIGVQYFTHRIDSDIVITNEKHPIFKNTLLKNGDKLEGLLGYEVDGVTEHSPSNITILSKSKAAYLKPSNMPLKSKLKAYAILLNYWLALVICIIISIITFILSKKYLAKKITTFFMSITLIAMVGISIGLFIFQKKNEANMTIYTTSNGSTVFAAGTIQWSWGLDDYNVPKLRNSRYDTNVEIITENVFAIMGVDAPKN